MKFTIAVGILAQALPAISETSPSKLLEQEVGNDHDLLSSPRAFKLMSNVGNSQETETETSSKSFQNLHGLLKNIPFDNKMKACDPSSNDPDVGILSCDAGYECVPDQDSTGGRCSLVSRDLQDAGSCTLCPDGSEMGYENFFLPVSGSFDFLQGYMPALPSEKYAVCAIFAALAYSTPQAGSDITPFDSAVCPDASSLVQSAGCCTPNFDCDLCGDAEFFPDTVYYDSPLFPITCGLIVRGWNDTACSVYASDAVPICCGEATTDGPEVPTPVPVVDSPSGATDAPAPKPSASEDKWSTNVLTSMISLTVATAGALLLN